MTNTCNESNNGPYLEISNTVIKHFNVYQKNNASLFSHIYIYQIKRKTQKQTVTLVYKGCVTMDNKY